MKKLSRAEMQEVKGGLAYYCCAYTTNGDGNNYFKCGITIEDAEARVEEETANGWDAYYECGVQQAN